MSFAGMGACLVTTEDGSEGEKGFVTSIRSAAEGAFHLIQTCGPTPMMKAVARYAKQSGVACEVSLENLMACGLGACLCCVEKICRCEDDHVANECVCVKEGPVFDIKKLLWQD